MQPIQNRYDFVYLFDVINGNPNGDPDAGNLPRLDPETSHGLVTDVCLKRKIRNYVAIKHGYTLPNDIYVKEKAILGRFHNDAYQSFGINLGEAVKQEIDESILQVLESEPFPDGVTIEEDDDERSFIVFNIDIDKVDVKKWVDTLDIGKDAKKILKKAVASSKSRKPKAEEIEQGQAYMKKRFFDIRTFGAVMSLKSAPNCGQVRGPVQFTFSRSIHPIIPLDISITRMAVATEAEAIKQGGDNRTMGRKTIVPYGLYRCHGFVSAPLAKQTGFSEDDLALLWESLTNMFDHDRSAARGEMAARGLIVFKHDSAFGNHPAHKLFDLVKVDRASDSSGPARAFSDYVVTVLKDQAPEGVTCDEML